MFFFFFFFKGLFSFKGKISKIKFAQQIIWSSVIIRSVIYFRNKFWNLAIKYMNQTTLLWTMYKFLYKHQDSPEQNFSANSGLHIYLLLKLWAKNRLEIQYSKAFKRIYKINQGNAFKDLKYILLFVTFWYFCAPSLSLWVNKKESSSRLRREDLCQDLCVIAYALACPSLFWR